MGNMVLVPPMTGTLFTGYIHVGHPRVMLVDRRVGARWGGGARHPTAQVNPMSNDACTLGLQAR